MKSLSNTTIIYPLILACILMGGFIIGPFSVRIYISIATLAYLLMRRYSFTLNPETKLYLAFIGLYLTTLIINGEYMLVNFPKYFFGRYFICFIVIYTFTSLIRNKDDIHNVIIFLIIIGIFNSIISFLQFYGYSSALNIAKFLNPTERSQEMLEAYVDKESGIGIGVVGIFNNIVKNGYVSASIAVISPYLFEISKNWKNKLFSFIIVVILMYTVFMTQQRTVTILSFVFITAYFIRMRFSLSILLLVILSFPFILVFYDFSFTAENLGRINNLYDNNRIGIYNEGVNFLLDNVFWGGQVKFIEKIYPIYNVTSSHNFILNAFIYSGLFGGIVIITLYLKMLKLGLKIIYSGFSKRYFSISYFISTALIIFLINSMTHNASLITGEEFVWILYILILMSIKCRNNCYQIN